MLDAEASHIHRPEVRVKRAVVPAGNGDEPSPEELRGWHRNGDPRAQNQSPAVRPGNQQSCAAQHSEGQTALQKSVGKVKEGIFELPCKAYMDPCRAFLLFVPEAPTGEGLEVKHL